MRFPGYSLFLLALFLLGAISVSCTSGSDEKQQRETVRPAAVTKPGCLGCHALLLDDAHREPSCTDCHSGSNDTSDAGQAHFGLLAKPAHPDHMAATCGRCHREQVQRAANSLHFTLKNEINTVRRAFGARRDISGVAELPHGQEPRDPLALADDLLRRRCLRCHPYYPGDAYEATRHATGCGACHLRFAGGRLASHEFVAAPDDQLCLGCHYGNFVGADYYGRFEHDHKWEYRTPYPKAGGYPSRPQGLEQHDLAPDIHQQRGLNCIDCHPGSQLKGKPGADRTSCTTCHGWQQGQQPGLANLRVEKGRLILTARLTGKEHPVPLLNHPAHRDIKRVACTVCHAQWSFNDYGTHLMRHDTDQYGLFAHLSIQGSFEVEQILETSYAEDRILPPRMTDKFTGELEDGLWYKGYELRRWQPLPVGRDDDGVLKVFRPLLDLHLSYVDQEDEVIFDAVAAKSNRRGMLPYTPHTIGKAGLFYRDRLKPNLPSPGSEEKSHAQ